MSRTEDFQHNIGCPVCKEPIEYIGNIDSTKEFEGTRVKVDDAFVLFGEGYHTTEGYTLALEVVVTCPTCSTKIKTTHSTRALG